MSNKLLTYHCSIHTDKSEGMVLSTDRLVVVRWKQTDEMTKQGKKAPSTVCVPVPLLALSIEPECLLAAMNDALCDIQDKAVRKYIESVILNDTSVALASIVVPSDLLTAQGLAMFASEEATSKRLSKDGIASWFDAKMKEPLEMAFASRSGVDDATLEKAIKQHREILCKLASPKDRLPEGIAKQMQKALGVVEDNDSVKLALNARLEAFIKPVDYELALGMDA